MRYYLSRIYFDTTGCTTPNLAGEFSFNGGVWRHAFQTLNPSVVYQGSQIKWRGVLGFRRCVFLRVGDEGFIDEGAGVIPLPTTRAAIGELFYNQLRAVMGFTDIEVAEIDALPTLADVRDYFKALND